MNQDPAQASGPTAEECPWAMETMLLINKLTPNVDGKAFDPDWFLLRQRLEEFENQQQKAMDLLDRAANRLADDTAPDARWWKDLFLLTGQHMVCTEEGWEDGACKDLLEG
jgi:hypothetical protein